MPRPFQATRFGRALARALGMQGQLPLTVVEDALPVFQISSEQDPETAYLLGQRRWSRGGTRTAVAGEFSTVALLNPAGSGLLVVVERYRNLAATSGRIGVLFNQVGAGGGGILAPLDTRITEESQRAVATVLTTTNAVQAIAVDLWVNRYTGVETAFHEEPVVLSPGHALAFENDTVNLVGEALFQWREFNPAPQEFAGRG